MADTPADNCLDDVVEGEILDMTCKSEFASALMTINNTPRTVGESLKRLHEQQDKLFPAESAKKAKLVFGPFPCL